MEHRMPGPGSHGGASLGRIRRFKGTHGGRTGIDVPDAHGRAMRPGCLNQRDGFYATPRRGGGKGGRKSRSGANMFIIST